MTDQLLTARLLHVIFLTVSVLTWEGAKAEFEKSYDMEHEKTRLKIPTERQLPKSVLLFVVLFFSFRGENYSILH